MFAAFAMPAPQAAAFAEESRTPYLRNPGPGSSVQATAGAGTGGIRRDETVLMSRSPRLKTPPPLLNVPAELLLVIRHSDSVSFPAE